MLGLRPGEGALLSFYRPVPYVPDAAPRAEYLASVRVRAAADGIATYRIRITHADGQLCNTYIVKAEVRGRTFEDLDNTISTFTLDGFTVPVLGSSCPERWMRRESRSATCSNRAAARSPAPDRM